MILSAGCEVLMSKSGPYSFDRFLDKVSGDMIILNRILEVFALMRLQRLLTLWPFLLGLLRFHIIKRRRKRNGTRNCEMV